MCEEIRIYVACLAAYNNGELHGAWIDATQELDEVWRQIHEMLKRSPECDAEEYAIHDYEGFGGYGLGEYDAIESVHDIACFIEEQPSLAAELLCHFGGSLDDAKKTIEEYYSGCYKSLADYAEELTDVSQIPANIAYYIDYQRMGRDMELGGDIYTVETAFDEVHVFWNHRVSGVVQCRRVSGGNFCAS